MEKDKQLLFSPLFLKYQAEFEKNPRSRVFAPLSEIYRKIGMTEKAMEILSQGIRFHPAYVMGYVGLGFCYYDLRQYNLAYTTLRPFVEENRDNIRLQKLFSDTCLALHKSDEALETLKYLLFINPRDKEIAAAVKRLEEEVDFAAIPVHKPIIIPDDTFDPSPVEELAFPTENLISGPNENFDDWNTVTLKPNEKIIESSSNQWQMSSPISLDLESEKVEENLVEFEEIIPEKKDTTPVVTHTLVDLYCGQGHLEKALEILDKILILNPSDQRTIDKKNEILMLMSPQGSAFDMALEAPAVTIAAAASAGLAYEAFTILSDEPKEVEVEEKTEEEGRRQLMDLIDEHLILEVEQLEVKPDPTILSKKYQTFLSKIQKRALDYQSRI